MIRKGFRWALVFVAAQLLFTGAWLAYGATKTIDVSGSLSANLESNGSMDLVISVKGLPDSEMNFIEGESSFGQRIEIILPAVNKSAILTSEGPTTESGKNDSFYWDLAGASIDTSGSSDNNEIIFNVTVYENSIDDGIRFVDKLEDEGGTEGIKVIVEYYSPGENGQYQESPTESNEIFISRIYDVPAEAPAGFAALPVHLGALLKWTHSTSVTFTDGESRAHGGVSVFIFKNPEGAIDLSSASYVSTGDATEDPQGSCTFTPSTEQGTSCITCTDEDTSYINATQVAQISGAELSRTTSARGEFKLSNLSEDDTYTFALQYKNGVRRTACYNLTPTSNLTLAELYGEEAGTAKDVRCFIATAAYGSPFHQRIEIFRWFRDSILLKLPGGWPLVRAYYEYSPVAADFIANHPSARWVAQWVLAPIGAGLSIVRALFEHILLTVLVLTCGLVTYLGMRKPDRASV